MIFSFTQARKVLTVLDSSWSGVSDKIALVADFLLRLTLAKVFFSSGWVKVSDWGSTLFLFQEEYKVPFLPPELAAYLATGAELGLSVLLVLGLLTRLSALGLFVLNGVAVLAYYDTLKDSPVALHDHWYWGLMLCIVWVLPLRQLSADYWLKRMD